MNTQEFINQLTGMKVNGLKDGVITMENGLQISHSVKLAEHKGDMPLRFVIRIGKSDVYVLSYAAQDDQENEMLVEMWRWLKYRAYEWERVQEQEQSKIGYALLHEGL